MPSPSFVIVGNPGCRRVAGFQEALGRRGLPAARVVTYAGLLGGSESLAGTIEPGAVLRIESPDREFAVERALIAAGAGEPDERGPGPARIGRDAALGLEFDRGRILHPRQWYLGFRALLREIDRQRAQAPPHEAMNEPGAIALMFDKSACHARFVAQGVPCPRGLGMPAGYDDLRDRMAGAGVNRAFVKLAHGSSASGVIALETDGRRVQAFTTVEVVRGGEDLHLYNSRAIGRIVDERGVAARVDAVCREGAHAEQWVPKAGLDGHSFDLRVVVIAGRAAHAVVRMSRGPMTNLHLGNRRGDADALRERMPPGAWEAALRACERAAAVALGGFYAGVDLVVAPGYRRLAVLEINAFGDLLPGLAWRGLDTYEAEIAAVLDRRAGVAG